MHKIYIAQGIQRSLQIGHMTQYVPSPLATENFCLFCLSHSFLFIKSIDKKIVLGILNGG